MVFEDEVGTFDEEAEEDDLDMKDPEDMEVDIDKEALWGEDEI